MAVIRLILLVAVLGGLTLLLAQNWSPVLSLGFLGMRSHPLPLALWIFFSAAAGAFTYLVIITLSNLSSISVGQQRKTPANSPKTQTTPNQKPDPPRTSPPPTPNQKPDDWEATANALDDDWGDPKTSEPQSGSVYSYSYNEPKNTAVGKSESVYDADYRVIIPPYQPPTTHQVEEDDWGIFDDDDSEKV